MHSYLVDKIKTHGELPSLKEAITSSAVGKAVARVEHHGRCHRRAEIEHRGQSALELSHAQRTVPVDVDSAEEGLDERDRRGRK